MRCTIDCRDRMRAFEKHAPAPSVASVADWLKEDELCSVLQSKITKSCADGSVDKWAAWDVHWEAVYGLAEATMRRTMSDFFERGDTGA